MLSSNTSAANGGANYIEDVFSTWLYTGNLSTQTITNGIDLAGKGGLVWIKNRDAQTFGQNYLMDTVRGIAGGWLSSNLTNAQSGDPGNLITAYNADGFTEGSTQRINASGTTYASWTFRKQPKFFTQGTYTGTGAARTITHDLGSVPGCIIVKRTNAGGDNWLVYHRSLGATKGMKLNLTDPQDTVSVYWNNTEPTATEFTVGSGGDVNASGGTYVYYAFAHNAGGFGLTGTDNVISCGSFTTDGSGNATVDLGYEPQWVLMKNASGTSAWVMLDNMRGWSMSNDAWLSANASTAEDSAYNFGNPTATGFNASFLASTSTYIYIAIRRGPMKVPTSGTSVYNAVAYTGDGTGNRSLSYGFPVDLLIPKTVLNTGGSGGNTWDVDRLRGNNPILVMNSNPAEYTAYDMGSFTKAQNSYVTGTSTSFINGSGDSLIAWGFRRAPGFFDEVCYTGTGSARTVAHNLTVAPELMIVKSRSLTSLWPVYTAATGATKTMDLSSTGAATTLGAPWSGTSPTASVFTVGTTGSVNQSGATYVAYLFASVPGVSKCGSYTGAGTTQQINCGFTGGARFVLIKRTDSTGDWYVWDSARGIVAGNDPYLLLNSTAAEVTNTDYVDTYSAGFEISSTAPAAINASGGTFIFLAIA